jgi:tetratricopeptide (TPR) repeat protein
MLADQIVDEAFSYTRDPNANPADSAERAALLLELASRVRPDDARILRLLAEAAHAAGRSDAERSALRALIKADPGDLVAQVGYLDFVAGATQAIDERARIYKAAFDSQALDPQIRSEMAVRLARIAGERGDTPAAREFLGQALTLNDVNVGALREWVRMTEKSPDERVRALAALLAANPYQPDAWLTLARLLETAGLHRQAGDALIAFIEQTQKDGGQPNADTFEEMAMELAIASRRAEAYPVLAQLASLEDAPLSVLVAARLVANEIVNIPTPAEPTTTGPATAPAARTSRTVVPAPRPRSDKPDLTLILRKRLLDSLKQKTPAALADAAWIELSVMPTPSLDVESWLNDYAAAAPNKGADDKTLARLRGWWLLRQGKTAEAQAALAPLADSDPLAQLGLARALGDQNKRDEAARQFNDLWSHHPTGMFALQVMQAARAAGVTLAETRVATQYASDLAAIPQAFWTAHRQPRDLELLSPDDLRPRYKIGDPITLNVQITNTSGRALPVGPDGAIKSTVGIIGVVRNAPAIGMYAIENLQRVYRLPPRGTIQATLRLDQGRLGSLFTANPIRTLENTFSLITAPRGTPEQAMFGLGGQVVTIQPPGITRVGVTLNAQSAGSDLDAIFREINGDDPQRQLVAIAITSALLGQLGPVASDPAASSETARQLLSRALLPMIKSPSPIVRAWTLRYLPAKGLSPELAAASHAMDSDPDPIVRASWATNEVIVASDDPAARKTTAAAILNQAGMEPDPVVKAWMRSIVKDLNPPPGSQPAR